MIFLEIDDEFRDLIPGDLLIEAAEKTLQKTQGKEIPSLAIKVTGDPEIQKLNATYRDVDKATDVLAFVADYFDPDLESRYLGDVVISYPRAADQAEKRGHPVNSELQLLVIHGILHLSGFDHGSPQGKEAMWKVQNQILQALDLDMSIEEEDQI